MKRIILVGLLAGAAMLVANFVLNDIVNAILPSLQTEYQNTAVFRPWSDPRMSLYFLYPFFIGLALALVWERTEGIYLPWSRFAFLAWLTISVPGMLITYASFQVSRWMILGWLLTGLVDLLLASWIYHKMLKR
ncbi:MAG TPA: hypothetical protein VMC43_00235 [Candidatus Paceibacterota bacterium]|nr:hypothetical protein [Candidatus Paceibacterota bacterium]